MMVLVVLSLLFFTLPVLSEALRRPPPPQSIYVNNSLLTWTPAASDDVTYTVQYSSFSSERWRFSEKWLYVPACVQISANSCDITAARAEGEHGCVRLRVQAERRGLNSSSVEACSQNGDACTPEVRLTTLPGTLVVRLNTNHDLHKEHGDSAKHRVYYGKEGTPLTNVEDDRSTVTIDDLEEGQRYCVMIQYTHFDEPVGLRSCPRCVLVPGPEKGPDQTALIVSLVVVVLLVVLIPLMAYVLIYHRKRIKRWMRPPCQIPAHVCRFEPIPAQLVNTSCGIPERYDVISSFTPKAVLQRD